MTQIYLTQSYRHIIQLVNINGTVSIEEFITCELLQGTGLSPLLLNNNTITLHFNVYINENTLLTLKRITHLLY